MTTMAVAIRPPVWRPLAGFNLLVTRRRDG